MKQKLYHYFGFMKNLYFWVGVIRVFIGIICILCLYRLWVSDGAITTKIIISLILLICSFGCFVEGIPYIKRTISSHRTDEYNNRNWNETEEDDE